jgi:hypothetical protein
LCVVRKREVSLHLTQACDENSCTIHSIFVYLKAFSYWVYFIASDHKIIVNEKLKGGRKQSWPILMFAYTPPGNLHGKLRKATIFLQVNVRW